MKKKNNPIIVADDRLILQLYVAGMSPKSMEAIGNVRKICSELMQDSFQLEIIDLYKHPELASEQQIVFSPSLVKRNPLPRKTLVGTFYDSEKVIRGLGITIKE
jgi:circadian clock protein KaiB